MGQSVTVIIPTHDHGRLIDYGIKSVLQQTMQDFRLVVIGDGAPDETRDLMQRYTTLDSRIEYLDLPKDSRQGEIYRHQVLSQSTSKFVAYLADDDLMLPWHLEYLTTLLADADFAHTLPLAVLGDDRKFYVHPGDLKTQASRDYILSGKNFIPLSGAGHTMDFYRRLPYGWRTTPRGTFTDLYMWQQILAVTGVRATTGFRPSLLHFPSTERRDWSQNKRLEELNYWQQRLTEPQLERNLTQEILRALTLGMEYHRARSMHFEQESLGLQALTTEMRAELTRLATAIQIAEHRAKETPVPAPSIELTDKNNSESELTKVP